MTNKPRKPLRVLVHVLGEDGNPRGGVGRVEVVATSRQMDNFAAKIMEHQHDGSSALIEIPMTAESDR